VKIEKRRNNWGEHEVKMEYAAGKGKGRHWGKQENQRSEIIINTSKGP